MWSKVCLFWDSTHKKTINNLLSSKAKDKIEIHTKGYELYDLKVKSFYTGLEKEGLNFKIYNARFEEYALKVESLDTRLKKHELNVKSFNTRLEKEELNDKSNDTRLQEYNIKVEPIVMVLEL